MKITYSVYDESNNEFAGDFDSYHEAIHGIIAHFKCESLACCDVVAAKYMIAVIDSNGAGYPTIYLR